MKKKVIVMILTGCILALGACGVYFLKHSRDKLSEEVVARDGKIVVGQDKWNEFLDSTQKGKSGEIKVTIKQSDTDAFEKCIRYDGNVYTIVKKETTGKEQETAKGKYLLSLKGEKNTEFNIITNTKCSFVEIDKSISSSNSADSVEFQFVFD